MGVERQVYFFGVIPVWGAHKSRLETGWFGQERGGGGLEGKYGDLGLQDKIRMFDCISRHDP